MMPGDLALTAWFEAHRSAGLTQFLLLITNWNSLLGVSVMSAVLAVLLYRRHEHAWLRLLVLAIPGILLLNVALKHVFRRLRPQLEDPLLTLQTYSFPSGHVSATTVFYGFVALFLLAHVKSRGSGLAIVAGALLMVLLVALSRVYLGAHYLSDVLAAMLEGAVWLGLCLALVRRTGVLR